MSQSKPSKLHWQEKVQNIRRFHVSCLRENPKWTLEMTAKELNRGVGSVSEDLTLADWLITHPKLGLMKTAKEALEFIRAKKKEMRLRDVG